MTLPEIWLVGSRANYSKSSLTLRLLHNGTPPLTCGFGAFFVNGWKIPNSFPRFLSNFIYPKLYSPLIFPHPTPFSLSQEKSNVASLVLLACSLFEWLSLPSSLSPIPDTHTLSHTHHFTKSKIKWALHSSTQRAHFFFFLYYLPISNN